MPKAQIVVKIFLKYKYLTHVLYFTRFKTEGRGTLHGISSTKDLKTYPTVQIIGLTGPAKVLVSCVEDSKPYRSHPHQLIGKGECKEGKLSNYKIFYNPSIPKFKIFYEESKSIITFVLTCISGVCIVTVQNCDKPIVFQHLGIARVKVKEILESLTLREAQKIDPFNQGFELKTKAKTISLHEMRLCFQVRYC